MDNRAPQNNAAQGNSVCTKCDELLYLVQHNNYIVVASALINNKYEEENLVKTTERVSLHNILHVAVMLYERTCYDNIIIMLNKI